MQHGFAGIAETGTLMLPCAPERPTTLNLLADTAIVVLRASPHRRRLRGSLGPAARRDCGGMPRNVMLVTGPSRSADIEQTLELGAHGPRRLHVVLVRTIPPRDKPSLHGVAAPHPSDRGRPRAMGELRQPHQAARRPRRRRAGAGSPTLRAAGRGDADGPRLPHAPSATLAPLADRHTAGGVDSATWHRFRTGKLPAARTLDLHGHTAQRAFHALAAFLRVAHAEGLRCVEVVTGQGGVLRRELPLWLNLPELRGGAGRRPPARRQPRLGATAAAARAMMAGSGPAMTVEERACAREYP